MASNIRDPLDKHLRYAFALDFIGMCLAARYASSFILLPLLGLAGIIGGSVLIFKYGRKEQRSNLSILFCGLGLCAGLVWSEASRLISLQKHGATTRGQVIEEGYNKRDQEVIRWIEYRYTVKGQTFITRNESNEFARGDSITIIYDTTDPGVSKPQGTP